MPGRAKHVCPERGCTTLIPAGQRHCDRHRWQKAWGGGFRPASRTIPDDVRRRVLARDKYHCQLRYEGCTTQATHCDHTIPVSEDLELTRASILAGTCLCQGVPA
jgi:5-methylcytosine-specific restriction endonuclease McrA